VKLTSLSTFYKANWPKLFLAFVAGW